MNCVFGPLLRSTKALELASVPEASAKTFEEVARRSGLDLLSFVAEPIDVDSYQSGPYWGNHLGGQHKSGLRVVDTRQVNRKSCMDERSGPISRDTLLSLYTYCAIRAVKRPCRTATVVLSDTSGG